MKKSVAIQHLRTLMSMVQRARANAHDPLLGFLDPDDASYTDKSGNPRLVFKESLAAKIMPWVFGDRCILPALATILDRYDKDTTLAPMDYYNMMYILDKFIPTFKAFTYLFDGELPDEKRIPMNSPSIHQILVGWDPE